MNDSPFQVTGPLFVKFECGCIGLPAGEDGRAWLVQTCDGDGEVAMSFRQMDGKTAEPVPPSRAELLLRTICGLIGDGYRMRDVRRALGVQLL